MEHPKLKLCCNCGEWQENGYWNYLYCSHSTGWNDTCKDWRFFSWVKQKPFWKVRLLENEQITFPSY